MFGELAAFLAAAAVVRRPRPDVPHLDQHLPTSAYPSGHTAATTCLYVAIAILVIGHTRGWWRWLFLVPAIAMPVLVALSRMYRGEHRRPRQSHLQRALVDRDHAADQAEHRRQRPGHDEPPAVAPVHPPGPAGAVQSLARPARRALPTG